MREENLCFLFLFLDLLQLCTPLCNSLRVPLYTVPATRPVIQSVESTYMCTTLPQAFGGAGVESLVPSVSVVLFFDLPMLLYCCGRLIC